MGAFDDRNLDAATQAEIDDFILSGKRLLGITVLAGALGDRSAAVDVFAQRFEELRAERPEAFTVDPDKYWDHFSL